MCRRYYEYQSGEIQNDYFERYLNDFITHVSLTFSLFFKNSFNLNRFIKIRDIHEKSMTKTVHYLYLIRTVYTTKDGL